MRRYDPIPDLTMLVILITLMLFCFAAANALKPKPVDPDPPVPPAAAIHRPTCQEWRQRYIAQHGTDPAMMQDIGRTVRAAESLDMCYGGNGK